MKRTFLTAAAITALFVMYFCKSGKHQSQSDAGPQPTQDPTVYKGVTDQSCAVEVSFGSYAAGIDGKAFEKVIGLIESDKIPYTAKNIGREGETRLCLPLEGMKKKQKEELIDSLKKIAKSGELVSVSIR